MENASKALIMAASVLIGILILSLVVYLFTSFAGTSAQIHEENAKKQIDQFNSQFTSYVGKEGITIYDVVSVANLATENNRYYEFGKRTSVPDANNVKDNYISVVYSNSNITTGGYNNNTIEKGYDTSTSYITQYYNTLISLDLKSMQNKTDENGTLYQALTEYDCQAEISPVTRKSV